MTATTSQEYEEPWLRQLLRRSGLQEPGPVVLRMAKSSAIVAALLAGTWLVYVTGGTNQAYPHVMYLGVLLGAYFYGIWGGLAAGALAGLVMGPWMPLDVVRDLSQPTVGWLSRAGFFIAIGGIGGALMQLNRRRLERNERLMREISEGYGRILRTFSDLVALRDEQTGGHCDRVALNATAVGKELGLSDQDLHNLYWAGILHDLGKVALPANILLKPGPLTTQEYQQVQDHVTYGADLLLSAATGFAAIAKGIRSHHERWDGSGYPEGLSGHEIPLWGRILAVVDVFEALTSKRPYRGPVEANKALEYVVEKAGTEFDPTVVAVFRQLYEQGSVLVAKAPQAEDDQLPKLQLWAA